MSAPAPVHLTICGVFEVPRMLDTNKFDAIISITDPATSMMNMAMLARRRKRIRNNCERALCLMFDDALAEGKHVEAPKLHHVAAMVEFARTIPPGSKVLVHCMAGISRSTAAAIIVLRELGMTHDDAQAHVLAVRPQAQPNTLMLELYKSVHLPAAPAAPAAVDSEQAERLS